MEEAQLHYCNYYAFIAFIILLVLLLAILYNNIIRSSTKSLRPPPSPPSLPIIGHLHLLKHLTPQSLKALSDKYGSKILLFCFGTRKVVVVSSLSAVEECFKTNDIVFCNRPFTLAGKHLSYDQTTVFRAPYGDLWRNLRRLLSLEIFSTNNFAKTSYIRQQEVQLLVNDLLLSYKRGTTRVELKSKFLELPFNILTMKISGKRYYGNNVDDTEEARQLQHAMEEMNKLFSAFIISDYLPVLRWIDHQGVAKKMISVMKEFDNFLQNLVDEHRKKWSMFQATGKHDQLTNKTIIYKLLKVQENEPEYYTDTIIKGIILILLTVGTETTSTAMEWAMSLLLNHPEAMEKVRAEIDDKVGKQCMLEEEDLPKLSYLQNVIKESLRLCNTVPLLVPHEASQDCKVGGFDIARGTTLMVNAWAIHMDPEVWENPTEFMPERFESWDGEGYKLIAFGAGRRGCPGEAMATRVMGLTLGTLIQGFHWESVDGKVVDMAEDSGPLTSKLVPLEATFKPRQHVFMNSM